jgi:hypothetical protein
VFRTALEHSRCNLTQHRDFQVISAPLPLLGARGVGAVASAVSTVTGEAVALVVGVSSTVEEEAVVFLVVVVGIVAAEVSEASVVGEEVGVAVISVDFAAVAVSVDGGRTECRQKISSDTP